VTSTGIVPASSAVPSIVIQFQQWWKITVVVGRARRLASLTRPPATRASTFRPVLGWVLTPALTSDAWTVPSTRMVDMLSQVSGPTPRCPERGPDKTGSNYCAGV
jgi:hypothetical protein